MLLLIGASRDPVAFFNVLEQTIRGSLGLSRGSLFLPRGSLGLSRGRYGTEGEAAVLTF